MKSSKMSPTDSSAAGRRRPRPYDDDDRAMLDRAAVRRCPSRPIISADWVMLQRGAIYRGLNNGTEAASRTNTGYEVRVSFSLASPPSSSFYHLDTPGVPAPTREEHGFYGGSAAVAADRNCILLQVSVPIKAEYGYDYPNDYFVYTMHRPRPPSLHCLPELSGRWMCRSGDAGIVCRGNDFVVAVLETAYTKTRTFDSGLRVWREAAKLALFFSSREDQKHWEVTHLTMPYSGWVSHDVVAVDGAICWINYDFGLIFCDVFEDCPELRFVKLPIKTTRERERFLPSSRSVGVSNGIRLIDVNNCGRKTSGFTITVWTLGTDNEWHKDSVVKVDHLWKTMSFSLANLPRSAPQFPIISSKDPDIIYFVLLDREVDNEVWVVALDTRTKTMESYVKYENNEESEEYKGMFSHTAFLCSDLSAFL